MKCPKCNHALPSDSEFCQYCGTRIEKPVTPPVAEKKEEPTVVVASHAPVVESSAPEAPKQPTPVEEKVVATPVAEEPKAPAPQLPDFGKMTPDEALNAILQVQAKNTVEAMEANSKSQPDNEGDADFGLVPEKPIFTLALKSVDGEKEYLDKLYTVNGEKIKYNRRGSTSVNGINGMIDIYETYLPSGQPYKTIYINMYGAKGATKAPRGFFLAGPETTTNSVRTSKTNAIRTNSPSDNLVFFTNISSMILTALAMFSIFIAMNVQDVERNNWENWNPTVVYIVLLLILGTFLGFAINSLVNKRFKLLSVLSTIPVIAAIITSAECSIMSYGYYSDTYKYYINGDVVDVFNAIWIICVVCALFASLIPVAIVAIKKINNNWHQSISYREKCYKRVAKIHAYLEKGIITQEEYEKTRKDILKYIK